MKRLPSAPSHLRPETRRWWREVVKQFALESHHLKILTAAGEALDRQNEARELLQRDGLIISGRQGKKPHPAAAIARDSAMVFAQLIKHLNLDVESPRQSDLF